jgi:hypothetical protein
LSKPGKPYGPDEGKIREEYTYCTDGVDHPLGDTLYYWWDWGDSMSSGWTGPYMSGESACANHTWTAEGVYEIRVKARDTFGKETEWSDPLPVTMPRNRISTSPLSLYLLEKLLESFPLLGRILASWSVI